VNRQLDFGSQRLGADKATHWTIDDISFYIMGSNLSIPKPAANTS